MQHSITSETPGIMASAGTFAAALTWILATGPEYSQSFQGKTFPLLFHRTPGMHGEFECRSDSRSCQWCQALPMPLGSLSFCVSSPRTSISSIHARPFAGSIQAAAMFPTPGCAPCWARFVLQSATLGNLPVRTAADLRCLAATCTAIPVTTAATCCQKQPRGRTIAVPEDHRPAGSNLSRALDRYPPAD